MTTIDVSEALRNLTTIDRRVQDTARLGISDVAKIAYRAAKETTLFKDRTGELRGTLDIVDTGAYAKRVIARAKHGRYIESGTKAHVILPKNAPMLRFVIGGRVVFARRVNHPGTAKRPFMENAAQAGSQAMSVVMREGAERAVNYP